MPLFKTRSSKIEPFIGTNDLGAIFDEAREQPQLEHVFFNVASTDQVKQSPIKNKKVVLTERMDDPEEICELSPLYPGAKGVVSSKSPRVFYRNSMDLCRADFTSPPNFLPSKKPSAKDPCHEDGRFLQDEEIVWKLKDTMESKAESSRARWHLRDVDKTSQLRHNYYNPVSSPMQNYSTQKWLQNPDRFYNCIKRHRLDSVTACTSALDVDERLKRSLFAKNARTVCFASDVLLFSCIQENNKDDLEFVLRNSNVDINICFNARQLSPLHLASMYGHSKCIQALLHYGANVNQLDPNGHTPLDVALSRLHFESVVLLIEAGADINQLTIQKLREFEKVKKIAERHKYNPES